MQEGPSSLKRILVASDLSDQAGLAIERAIELGAEHSAEVSIVHVIDEDLPREVQSFLTTTSDHDIREKIKNLPKAGSVTTMIDIVSGRPDLDIVERADVECADMIVVGLHKRILDENLAIQGTIAEQIIQATHLPVLVVKNKPNGAYGSVIVGVDFSAYSRAAVRSAARIAPSADMHLVHAYGTDAASRSGTQGTGPGARSATAQQARLASFVEEEMLALKTSTGVGRSTLNRVHQVSQPGEPHTVLKDQARQLHAELIVMGTHGRIGVARSILGSVTTELLNDRLADVLVIKPF